MSKGSQRKEIATKFMATIVKDMAIRSDQQYGKEGKATMRELVEAMTWAAHILRESYVDDWEDSLQKGNRKRG